jgi:hypothetical protein
LSSAARIAPCNPEPAARVRLVHSKADATGGRRRLPPTAPRGPSTAMTSGAEEPELAAAIASEGRSRARRSRLPRAAPVAGAPSPPFLPEGWLTAPAILQKARGTEKRQLAPQRRVNALSARANAVVLSPPRIPPESCSSSQTQHGVLGPIPCASTAPGAAWRASPD